MLLKFCRGYVNSNLLLPLGQNHKLIFNDIINFPLNTKNEVLSYSSNRWTKLKTLLTQLVLGTLCIIFMMNTEEGHVLYFVGIKGSTVKPKPKLLLCPITTDTNNATNQSELQAKTCHLRQAWD